MTRTYAAADIGSNTAHLLVAATDGKLVMRIDNVNEWIPLGEEVARSGEISKERVDQLVAVLKEFRQTAQVRKAEGLYVFATEAVRAAKNHEVALKRIKKESGVTVQIASPDQEAQFSLRGTSLDTVSSGRTVMIEVGGGSAQILTVGLEEGAKDVSLKLGTGTVIAKTGLSHPCSESDLASSRQYIQSELDKLGKSSSLEIAVGSGGVIRGIWRALHPDGEKTLSIQELDYLIWSCGQLSISRIVERFSVKPKRAGTLLAGSLVYRMILDQVGLSTIAVSEFGVREGAILEMANGNVLFTRA